MDTVMCRDCDKADCPARDKVRIIYPCEKEEQKRVKKELDAYWAGSCAGVLKNKKW